MLVPPEEELLEESLDEGEPPSPDEELDSLLDAAESDFAAGTESAAVPRESVR